MSSILTNNSAMVALQTLQNVNKNLGMTQAEISTGKSVANARDNAAIWSISKQMESDVRGFTAIQDSLNLGQSTVAVARNAAETTTDLLQQMKEKIVSAQSENVDRAKLQTDIQELAKQINSVTGAAQFNGLNLVRGGDDVNVLSSLDRAADGSVTSSSISVTRQNLGEAADVAGAGVKAAVGTLSDTDTDGSLTAANQTIVATVTQANDETLTLELNDVQVRFTMDGTATANEGRDGLIAAFNSLKEVDSRLEGITLATNANAGEIVITNENNLADVSLAGSGSGAANVAIAGGATSLGRSGETITIAENAAVNEGDSFTIGVPGGNIVYVAREGDNAEDVANGLKAAVQASGNSQLEAGVEVDGGNVTLSLGATGTTDLAVTFTENADGTVGGDLFGLSAIDVTTDTGASNALGLVETLIGRSIDAASELGSAQGRIDTQSDFMSKLTDSFKSGIGALVDANMEEASARLQALQVQQQLATQSLSIANQAPQSILSLFR